MLGDGFQFPSHSGRSPHADTVGGSLRLSLKNTSRVYSTPFAILDVLSNQQLSGLRLTIVLWELPLVCHQEANGPAVAVNYNGYVMPRIREKVCASPIQIDPKTNRHGSCMIKAI